MIIGIWTCASAHATESHRAIGISAIFDPPLVRLDIDHLFVILIKMTKKDKILQKIVSGTSDANCRFSEIRNLLETLGFSYRIKGDHFIYFKNDVTEILNLQPLANGMAKPYQVRQVRNVILKYKMGAKE